MLNSVLALCGQPKSSVASSSLTYKKVSTELGGGWGEVSWPAWLMAALLAASCCGPTMARGDEVATNASSASKFPCNPAEIAHYTAYRVNEPIKVDGRLDEAAWKVVPRSPRFVDIITGKPTIHDTRAAMMWDDQNLYVGYWVEEPNVKATFTKHNSPIWQGNDVEIFIAGQDTYYEFEINALNTVYEAFFIWEDAYEKGGYAAAPEFQRSNPEVKPFNGVGFTTHPRGPRLGSWAWSFPGMQTAIHVDGTLNNDQDKDHGWTVELAFPWAGMKWLAKADGRALPPKAGDVWRIDLSRFNQYKAPPPAADSGGWFWSRHGVWDSHIPECFPFIQFSTNDVINVKAANKAVDKTPAP